MTAPDAAASAPFPPRDHPLLSDYADQPPLPEERLEGSREVINPARKDGADRSEWYEKFGEPYRRGEGDNGFDIHVYYDPSSASQHAHAAALRELIRRTFPEFRVYRLWDKPVGPHPLPFFEVNVFTPGELGALLALLTVKRGPLSVLVHPNTDDELRDHRELGFFLGDKVELDLSMFKEH